LGSLVKGHFGHRRSLARGGSLVSYCMEWMDSISSLSQATIHVINAMFPELVVDDVLNDTA